MPEMIPAIAQPAVTTPAINAAIPENVIINNSFS
jgi:hypothetical protein